MIERESGRFISGRSASPATQILKGERKSPSTEFKPGQRMSVATEFIPGQPAHNKLPIGSVRTRIETHTRSPRAWIKLADPDVWQKRAIVVWEAHHARKLPRGWVVHHRDRDSMNDEPANLQAMTKQEHINEHRNELKP